MQSHVRTFQKVIVSDCGFLKNYDFQPADTGEDVSPGESLEPNRESKSPDNSKTVEQSPLVDKTKSILSQSHNTMTVPPNTMNAETPAAV